MLLCPLRSGGEYLNGFSMDGCGPTYYPINTRLLCCLRVRNVSCGIDRLESARVALSKNIHQFVLVNLHFPELVRISSVGLHTKTYTQVSQGRGGDDVFVVHLEEVFFTGLGFE